MNSEAFSEQQGLAKLTVIKFNHQSYGSWTKLAMHIDLLAKTQRSPSFGKWCALSRMRPMTTTSRSNSNARTAIKLPAE
jgi:hypothetical protein